jgi:hypothetical protein
MIVMRLVEMRVMMYVSPFRSILLTAYAYVKLKRFHTAEQTLPETEVRRGAEDMSVPQLIYQFRRRHLRLSFKKSTLLRC